MSLVEKLFGSFSDRELKKVNPITKQVLALEPKYQAMSDADLQAQTAMFKQQLAEGKTLDDILPDAFAVCREAAWRVLGMKHFPVQVTGGIALHRGDIAEMQTGEGKTLVATLPAYLNALTGEGVHIVTVNDYLAKRDSEWMGKLYRWLGLTVGLIVQGMDGDARRAVALIDDRLVVGGVLAGTESLVDGGLDLVLGHGLSLGLSNGSGEAGVVLGQRVTAETGSNGDVAAQLGEEGGTLGVLRALTMLGCGPLRVSGHTCLLSVLT